MKGHTVRAMIAVAFMLVAALAFAQQPPIQVDNAWSRTAAAGGNGVVYLTVTDSGAPDRLTGAASPVASAVELHESLNDNGVRKMRPVASLPVDPGKTLTLAPGGYHIMLIGLKQALKAGTSFPVTLSFERAGQVTATATVRQTVGGKAMDHSRVDMPGMDMH